MQHGETAEQLFRDGYNCAQAVLMAFADVTGLEPDTAARLASSFGGGLGRMREVCGAVSGASMVLGLVKGYADPTDADAKKAHNSRAVSERKTAPSFAATFSAVQPSGRAMTPKRGRRHTTKNAPVRHWCGRQRKSLTVCLDKVDGLTRNNPLYKHRIPIF